MSHRTGKGGTCVRITVIRLPRPLGKVLMVIMRLFSGKRGEGRDAA